MLLYKQLGKQIFSNRIFMTLLFILNFLTSLTFFFVRFTIDGNAGRVKTIVELGGDGARYSTALSSNSILSYGWLIAMTVLTAFVFFIFYYRFFRAARRQIGCLKALGFKDARLQIVFAIFPAAVSLTGGVLGLLAGYPLSEVLIQANKDAYGVTGLVKSIHAVSIITGLFVPAAIFFITGVFSYFFIRGKEPGSLIAGTNNRAGSSKTLLLADRAVGRLPVKNKFPVRIALRKPLSIFLIIAAVMSFSVCMILAYSLNISSRKIFTSQTEGHHYEYVIKYDSPLMDSNFDNTSLKMLSVPGAIKFKGKTIPQKISGVYELNELYELTGITKEYKKGTRLSVPSFGRAIIGPALKEVYGIRIGDTLSVQAEGKEMKFTVDAIADNGQSAVLYVNGEELSQLLALPSGSFNRLLADKLPDGEAETVTTSAERIRFLKQDAVSNQVSGVINQVIGAAVGCILLFLSLFVSFQDNIRDIVILHLMGYRPKEIRKLLIDLYRPFVLGSFVLTLIPAVWMVQSIQNSLSVSTGDYMPFGTNIFVILLVCLMLIILYQLVQWVFEGAVRRVVRKEETAEYTSGE